MTIFSCCRIVISLTTLFSLTRAAAAQAQATRFDFKAIDCRKINCEHRMNHGNLTIHYSNGKTTTIATKTVLGKIGQESDAKIATDGRILGWLEGEHIERSGGYFFAGTRLHILRVGKPVSKIQGQRYFVEAWKFWSNGSQVVLRSRATHGPATDELHDALTGRIVSQLNASEVTKRSPKWAQEITDENVSE